MTLKITAGCLLFYCYVISFYLTTMYFRTHLNKFKGFQTTLPIYTTLHLLIGVTSFVQNFTFVQKSFVQTGRLLFTVDQSFVQKHIHRARTQDLILFFWVEGERSTSFRPQNFSTPTFRPQNFSSPNFSSPKLFRPIKFFELEVAGP